MNQRLHINLLGPINSFIWSWSWQDDRSSAQKIGGGEESPSSIGQGGR